MKHLPLALGLLLLIPRPAAAQAPPPQPAGEVRAVVPVGQIVRGGAPPKDAKRSDPIYWQDTARTARGGRMRIGLLDGSILNVGSESELQIRRHNPGPQQTTLELTYGRLRAKAVRLVQPDAKFEVRTPTGVVGVVGTHFIIRILADFDEVFCLEELVRVRNRDLLVYGEAILRAGEFTRIRRGLPPSEPARAAPEQIREALEETEIPAGSLDWSRAEISWPPAGCGGGVELVVRAWSRQSQGGKEVETPVDPELVSGSLRLGQQTLSVEAARASLAGALPGEPPEGGFTPAGRTGAVPTKIWPPQSLDAGEGWRAPRAVFVGSAFYVLGPIGAAGIPVFEFGPQPAELLWQGPCGAAFLAPRLRGGEYEVALTIRGQIAARGKMNLIEVEYHLPSPPSVSRGQQTSFGIDLRGLAGLDRFTQGRPVMVVTLTNQTPEIIGDLRSSTPGAQASGETLTFEVGSGNIDATGTARLEGSARGRRAGNFVLGIQLRLDEALERPRTPLSPETPPR